MTPILTEQIGGYLVSWPDSEIEAKVSRIHVHSDGHVSGMLAVTHSNGHGPMRLLPNTQFNFSADMTRAKQAKQLAEKYSQIEANWIEMFDYLGEEIQRAALAGSPAVEIEANEDAEAPPLLIRPTTYRGHQNILYGEKGVNKSTLAYALSVFMIRPEWSNPLNLAINTTEPVKTLVLDWETDQPTFQWYLGRLMRGMHFGPVPVYYRHCRLPLAQDIEPIADEIERTGAKHLVIDSLAAAAAGDNGDFKSGGASALEFNAALRKLPGITSTIIGQTAKNTESNKKTVFGSTLFTYYARNIFELCRGEDREKGALHLGLFHRECNFALKSEPIGICVRYGERDSISMEREEVSIAEFAEKVPVTQKILNILREGPLSTKGLMERTTDKRNTVDKALERLRSWGKVLKVGNDWELTDPANPSDEEDGDED